MVPLSGRADPWRSDPMRGQTEAMTTPEAVRALTPGYEHVLVPLDGSDLAADAIGTARALAERFGADLHTVSAAPTPAAADKLRLHAAAMLGTGADDPRIDVEVAGDPASVITQRAEKLETCLVCMSTHGRGRVSGAVMGSVARRVLETRNQPIVAVGPFADRPAPFSPKKPVPLSANHLVACVDGGEASEHVLPVAAGWATALGMSMTILTVAEPTPPPLQEPPRWHRLHGPNEDAEAYLHGLAERWRGQVPELQTQVVYDPISAAGGMRTYLDSHRADLLAVTTHGRSGLQRLVLGAGAASIIHASTAPVLVVPIHG
jgi:nucleotide-binding universal stress UspA family protein